ncbi:MAG: hypothetical protein ACFFCS_10740 [Candidatus Hodarchaeota archaeon]
MNAKTDKGVPTRCMYCHSEFFFVSGLKFCPNCDARINPSIIKQIEENFPAISSEKHQDSPAPEPAFEGGASEFSTRTPEPPVAGGPPKPPPLPISRNLEIDDYEKPDIEMKRAAAEGAGSIEKDWKKDKIEKEEKPEVTQEIVPEPAPKSLREIEHGLAPQSPVRCPNCLVIIPLAFRDGKFCSSCGADINPVQNIQPAAYTTTVHPPPRVQEVQQAAANWYDQIPSNDIAMVSPQLLDQERAKAKKVAKQLLIGLLILASGLPFLPITVSYSSYKYNLNVDFLFWSYNSDPYYSTHFTPYSYWMLNPYKLFWGITSMVLFILCLVMIGNFIGIASGKSQKSILSRHIRNLGIFAYGLGGYTAIMTIQSGYYYYSSYSYGVAGFLALALIIPITVLAAKNRRGPWITIPTSWDDVKNVKPRMKMWIQLLIQFKEMMALRRTGEIDISSIWAMYRHFNITRIRSKLRNWRMNKLIEGTFTGYNRFFIEKFNFPLIYNEVNRPAWADEIVLNPMAPVEFDRGKAVAGFVLGWHSVVLFIIAIFVSAVYASYSSSSSSSSYSKMMSLAFAINLLLMRMIGSALGQKNDKKKPAGVLLLVSGAVSLYTIVFFAYSFEAVIIFGIGCGISIVAGLMILTHS